MMADVFSRHTLHGQGALWREYVRLYIFLRNRKSVDVAACNGCVDKVMKEVERGKTGAIKTHAKTLQDKYAYSQYAFVADYL